MAVPPELSEEELDPRSSGAGTVVDAWASAEDGWKFCCREDKEFCGQTIQLTCGVSLRARASSTRRDRHGSGDVSLTRTSPLAPCLS